MLINPYSYLYGHSRPKKQRFQINRVNVGDSRRRDARPYWADPFQRYIAGHKLGL